VTETFDCSGVPEEQRPDIGYGKIWAASMRRTLERLDQLCTGSPAAGAQAQGCTDNPAFDQDASR
jgi:hypothetical protein